MPFDDFDPEQRFFPEFDMSTPPIERHPQGEGLHAAFVHERLYLRSLNPGFGQRGHDAANRTFLAASVMRSASLWKAIDDQWGNTDGMVEGKHHQARLYAFTFMDRTLLCTTETGERGSNWFLVDRVLDPKEPSLAGTVPISDDSPDLPNYWHPFVVAFTHQVKHHPSIQPRWRRALGTVVEHDAKRSTNVARTNAP